MLDADRQDLIDGNLSIATSVAKSLSRYHPLGFEDAQQDAFVGLVLAATKWDPTKSVPFGAMAFMCARKQVLNRIEKFRNAKMTTNLDPDSFDMRTVEPPTGVCLSDDMLAAMQDMDPTVRQAIECRFGLRDGADWTYEEIGNSLGLTKQRALQLVAAGLLFLRRRLGAYQ